jgi:hypothetical protein
MTTRVPNDVVIFFPRTGQSLWSNEKLLSNASPYLSTALINGFAESSHSDKIDAGKAKSLALEPY